MNHQDIAFTRATGNLREALREEEAINADLLAALEHALSELNGDPHRYKLCDAIAAAIAKAKGE